MNDQIPLYLGISLTVFIIAATLLFIAMASLSDSMLGTGLLAP